MVHVAAIVSPCDKKLMSDCPHSVALLWGSGEGTNPHFRSDPLCDRWKPCYHIANLFWMHQLESNDAFWRSFTFIVVQLMYDLEERGGMLRAIFISHACETGVVRQAMGQKRCSWYCTGQHNASHRGVLCYDRKLADWKVGETDEGGHRAVFERPEKAFYWRGRDN